MSVVTGKTPQKIPRNAEIKAYLYANAVLGETQRYRILDRYEAHYECRQYAHQERDWWGMNADNMETISPDILTPFGFTQPAMGMAVRMKRPTAPYNLCKSIVDRFTGLLFSEKRRPDVVVEGDPDTQDFLDAAFDQMRFWARMREARTMGGALGSVMVTLHVRRGRFVMEVHNPKHCQVVWKDKRSLLPEAVLKAYRYEVEEDIIDEKTGEVKGTRVVDYLYRRIITETDDTVYKPVKLEPGAELAWEVESQQEHNLGFFPGVWIQNLPVLEQEDGEPDCAGAWQNFDTIDRLLSQMNKAILLNLDPTLVLSVEPKVVDMQGGVRKGSENALMVGQGGQAQYLEITGSGVEAAKSLYNTLKQNTLDVCSCVMVDPERISGAAQSAKAIEYIYAPMLVKGDDLRAQYGDLGVQPLAEMVERIARKLHGVRVNVGNVTAIQVIQLPPRFNEKTGKAEPRRLGEGGYIRLKWGPYFEPTEQDRQTAITNIVTAKTGGVLDTETAVREAAPIFEVEDPDAVLKRLAEEEEKMLNAAAGGITDLLPGAEGEIKEQAEDVVEVAEDVTETRTAPSEPSVTANVGGDVEIELTASTMASIVTVNEARSSQGLGPLLRPDGSPDPDGKLTISSFEAKRSSVIATAEAAKKGEQFEPADKEPLE